MIRKLSLRKEAGKKILSVLRKTSPSFKLPETADVLLVAPPRLMWPYINAYDNFMVPQNLPCLAGYLRSKGISVAIIDAMPLRMGWRTLVKTVEKMKPKIVAAGENHALFSGEVIKLFKFVKIVLPDVITVAGGSHFSFLAEEILRENPEIDFVVVGEGEETFWELCSAVIESGGKPDPRSLRKIKGIVFRDGDEIVRTEPRELLNLDDLPMPAYDLLPMREYGKSPLLFASWGSTIHHSRGCTSSCEFCGFWIQMAEAVRENGKVKLRPRWRTKSPERTFEEVRYLYEKFERRFLVWVDDTFNTDPRWCDEFAELVLKSGIRTRWYAFCRADFLLRDQKLGVLPKLVRAGLQHISIGAERPYDSDFKELRKNFYSTQLLEECVRMLKSNYPQVFIQLTFITGLRSDTPRDFQKILEFAKKLSPDYAGFHPLTPLPGTPLWYKAKEKGWIEVDDFNLYDFVTAVMGTEHMSREEVEELTIELYRKYVSFRWFLKGMLGGDYKRRMYLWWLLVSLKITAESLLNLKLPWNEYHNLVFPSWYWD